MVELVIDGGSIRDARQRAGLTQQQLAHRLGVSQRTVGNWERGDTVPINHEARIRDILSDHLEAAKTGDAGLSTASDVELLAEIARRFARTKEAGGGHARSSAPMKLPPPRPSAEVEEDLAYIAGELETLRSRRRSTQDAARPGLERRRAELEDELARAVAWERNRPGQESG